jgi:hypothetical protein
VTVIERLYDNAWYVAHAAPAVREQLAADVTRTWMEAEAAQEELRRARTVAALAPSRSALALSLGNSVRAAHERAKARAAEAARCTDIVGGHAFEIRRTTGPDGAMTMEVHSCTLLRHATLSRPARAAAWQAVLTDPQSRWGERTTTTLGGDAWDALHWTCNWVVTGEM